MDMKTHSLWLYGVPQDSTCEPITLDEAFLIPNINV